MEALTKPSQLQGSLSETPSLTGILSTQPTLSAVLLRNNYDADEYEDEYEVVSKVNEDEILNTAKKYLRNDIVVKAIPYAEVSNLSGGRTVTIGG